MSDNPNEQSNLERQMDLLAAKIVAKQEEARIRHEMQIQRAIDERARREVRGTLIMIGLVLILAAMSAIWASMLPR